jgi:hypothetical protein
MDTQGNSTYLDFPMLGRRAILADFDGGDITSDGGALLLRKTEPLTALIRQFVACCTDHRNPDLIEHTVTTLVAQRVYSLALGYEDLNDQDDLRCDPWLAAVVGKDDPTGQARQRPRDRGPTLAGKSTLNRLELTPVGADEGSRSKKVTCRPPDVARRLGTLFLPAHARPPERSVRDRDATDDPVHGHQRGRFFPGYSKSSCSLPLSLFWGHHRLCVRLRPANIEASAGTRKQLPRIVTPIREAGPDVKITSHAESGFCRDPILTWCEAHGVGDVRGLAQNKRLWARITAEQEQARLEFERTKVPARMFAELRYRTRDSSSRVRRVVAQAEHLTKGANPRLVVTSLEAESRATQALI